MSEWHVENGSCVAMNDVAATPRLTEVSPERSLLGELMHTAVSTAFLTMWVGILFHQISGLTAVPAIIYWANRLISEVFWNRLNEPVFRLSSEVIRPGKEILVECELRARTEATIRGVVVGVESHESSGEDTRVESYEEWILPFPLDPIGQTPIAADLMLPMPTNVGRRWNGSDLKWYVTLQVEVKGGITIRRRYRFEMWA